MPISPCARQPFEGTQQFEIPYGTTIVDLTRNVHGGITDWILNVCRRPVVPVWGVTLNGATGTYDFVPSTKGHEQTLIEIANAALLASVNFVEDAPVANAVYEGDYGDYLYRKVISAPCMVQRFAEVYNKSSQFFRLHGAIVVFDLPLYKELTDLLAKVMRESDKQMFIPPGRYTFTPGNAANTALEAWHLADATFSKLYGIELITT